jgi:transcriptional regulator with XRE-family HTH domain
LRSIQRRGKYVDLDFSLREIYQMLRKKKKIKLKVIANVVGVSIPMLSMYENGIVNLQYDKEQKYRVFVITFPQ